MQHQPLRPVLRLPRSALDRWLGRLALLMVALSWAALLHAWPHLPDRVPTHFGLTGTPDAFGDRATLLTLPLLNVAFYLLLSLLQRVPHRFNYVVRITAQNAARQYTLARTMLGWLTLEVSVLLMYATWQTAMVAMGQARGLPALLPPLLGGMFGVTVIGYLFAARAAAHT